MASAGRVLPGSVEASRQILRRSDAYDQISRDQVGRAFMQVGNNDLFEKIQVAYSGALNIPRTNEAAEITISELDLDGKPLPLFSKDTSKIPGDAAPQTHLDLLVKMISQTAK